MLTMNTKIHFQVVSQCLCTLLIIASASSTALPLTNEEFLTPIDTDNLLSSYEMQEIQNQLMIVYSLLFLFAATLLVQLHAFLDKATPVTQAIFVTVVSLLILWLFLGTHDEKMDRLYPFDDVDLHSQPSGDKGQHVSVPRVFRHSRLEVRG